MEDCQLQQLVSDISLKWFGKSFSHKALFNTRLRTTAGRYVHGSHIIEINPHYYRIHGEAELIATIKHELCHYHLALAKCPFDHRAEEFRQLLKKVGGSRYAKPSPELANKKHTMHRYICSQCRHVYHRRRRINTRRYVCGKCKGQLVMP